MEGGEISGNTATAGGGVNLGSSETSAGTFTMTGGTISGNNKAESIDPDGWYVGGGVNVSEKATFTMSGGKISNNNASQAGGVAVDGTFFLKQKGEISDNTAKGGGGVNVYGTFIMEDGKITGNIASEWSSGGVGVGSEGTFTMKGGEISRNTSYYGGGGVFVRSIATFNKSGGTIIGYNNDPVNGNKIIRDGEIQIYDGSAILVQTPEPEYEYVCKKETTANQSVNLSYNGITGSFSGGWD